MILTHGMCLVFLPNPNLKLLVSHGLLSRRHSHSFDVPEASGKAEDYEVRQSERSKLHHFQAKKQADE